MTARRPSIYRLRGEIDAGTADLLDARNLTDGESPDGVITLDLSEVTFVDSSGLRALVELQRVRAADHGGMVLRSPQRNLIRLLEIAGLADHFVVED